jgi:hypothetical protein
MSEHCPICWRVHDLARDCGDVTEECARCGAEIEVLMEHGVYENNQFIKPVCFRCAHAFSDGKWHVKDCMPMRTPYGPARMFSGLGLGLILGTGSCGLYLLIVATKFCVVMLEDVQHYLRNKQHQRLEKGKQ